MKAEAATYAGMAFALSVLVACSGVPQVGTAPPGGGPVDASMGIGITADPASGRPPSAGYLAAAETPDATAIIPPAPREGEARNDADWKIFRDTRAIQQLNPDRWALAKNDDSYLPADILKDFSCAMGVELTIANSPKLSAMLTRASQDAANAAAKTKEVYKRTRPFMHNYGDICIAKSDGLMKSYDYPSGHSSASWVEGLILSSLAPDRAEKLLTRARAYGESRIVCGVHNWSAVEGGRTNAAGVFAALQGSAAYQKAFAEVRSELSSVRKTGKAPDAAACSKEAELIKPLILQ
jgi:acid phosphatase (class A)